MKLCSCSLNAFDLGGFYSIWYIVKESNATLICNPNSAVILTFTTEAFYVD